jgi:hypothetical protein
MKAQVYEGLEIYVATRRVNDGRIVWIERASAVTVALNTQQLQALVTVLPWRTLAADHAITVI